MAGRCDTTRFVLRRAIFSFSVSVAVAASFPVASFASFAVVADLPCCGGGGTTLIVVVFGFGALVVGAAFDSVAGFCAPVAGAATCVVFASGFVLVSWAAGS